MPLLKVKYLIELNIFSTGTNIFLPKQKICGLFFVTLQSNNNIYELKIINGIKIELVEKKNDKNVSHNK